MATPWLLVAFIPGRSRLGALGPALHKHGLQYVLGCEEPNVRQHYAGRNGVLLSLAEWEPEAEVKGRGSAPPRVKLPAGVVGMLMEIAGSPGIAGFEVMVLPPDGTVRTEARLPIRKLTEPLATSCRYIVPPPGPEPPLVTPEDDL